MHTVRQCISSAFSVRFVSAAGGSCAKRPQLLRDITQNLSGFLTVYPPKSTSGIFPSRCPQGTPGNPLRTDRNVRISYEKNNLLCAATPFRGKYVVVVRGRRFLDRCFGLPAPFSPVTDSVILYFNDVATPDSQLLFYFHVRQSLTSPEARA